MSESKDRQRGTFFYRFRMIHASKGTRTECLLTTYHPSRVKGKAKESSRRMIRK
jgi:hypothetical protein